MKYLLLSVFSLSIVFSCAKLDELSDTNTILGLSISEHWPKSIEIDSEPAYVGDTIFIPVIYGKYDFPLYFRADLQVDNDVYKVMGIDFSRELVLNSMDDELKFYVMAKSGKTRVYIIKAKEKLPLEENNYILSPVEIRTTSGNALFSGVASRSLEGDTIKLPSINVIYPIRITPRFSIPAGAEFRNFDNGTTTLVFNNSKTVHRLKVVSQSGAEKIWNIMVDNLPLLNGGSTVGAGQDLTTTAISPRTFSADVTGSALESNLYAYKEMLNIDNMTNSIKVVIAKSTQPLSARSKRIASRAAPIPSSGVDVAIKFPLGNEDVQVLQGSNSEILHFTNYDEQKVFYLLDPYAGVARKWVVNIEEYKETGNNVLAFNHTYTAPDVKVGRTWTLFGGFKYTYAKSIVMEVNKTEIYPNDAEIYLYVTPGKIAQEFGQTGGVAGIGDEFNNSWKVTINATMQLSSGAQTSASSFVWQSNATQDPWKINDCWVTPKTFTVTSETGEIKTWTIHLKEGGFAGKSGDASLVSFDINRIAPTYVNIKETIVNTDDIELSLQESTGIFPLKIYPTIKAAPYASYTPAQGAALVFNSIDDVQQIIITAQDGVTKKTIDVRLKKLASEAGKEINSFSVTSISNSLFKVSNISIDKESDPNRGIVTLSVNSDEVYMPAIDISYRMSTSVNSKPSIPTVGTLRFNKPTDIHEFDVTSEQDGESKHWIVRLSFLPQLPNNNFNSWTGNINSNKSNDMGLKFWATANNSYMDTGCGTFYGVGYSGVSGDAAPHMITGTAMIKKAAASTFIGRFEFSTSGMSDPVKLTFQGVPFNSTATIKAVELNAWYSPAGNDYGSILVELVKWNGSGNYVYHGNKPTKEGSFDSAPHPDNTAKSVAKTHFILSPNAGTTPGGATITVVPNGQWVTLTLPMPYGNGPAPDFTHFNIICGSSAYGDAFIANPGSKLSIDNVKILYE